MAALTTTALTSGEAFVRTATAQATVGQTDWLDVPVWAKYMTVDFNLTAVAGTTPSTVFSLVVPDLTTRDSSTGVVNLMGYTAFTTITGAARLLGQVGPGVTGIADDVTTSATGTSNFSLNCILPPVIGVRLVNDRDDADETYTYNLAVTFRRA